MMVSGMTIRYGIFHPNNPIRRLNWHDFNICCRAIRIAIVIALRIAIGYGIIRLYAAFKAHSIHILISLWTLPFAIRTGVSTTALTFRQRNHMKASILNWRGDINVSPIVQDFPIRHFLFFVLNRGNRMRIGKMILEKHIQFIKTPVRVARPS